MEVDQVENMSWWQQILIVVAVGALCGKFVFPLATQKPSIGWQEEVKYQDGNWLVVEGKKGTAVVKRNGIKPYMEFEGFQYMSLRDDMLKLQSFDRSETIRVDLSSRTLLIRLRAETLVLPAKTKVRLMQNKLGIQTAILPYALPPRFLVKIGGRQFEARGIKLAEIQGFGGKPGTMFTVIPPVKKSGEIEVEILQL